ncbi:MAG: DUF1722 domain-containing protein [candidate division Zixibacteria bacterium]|nr:DUF1722 domain-containing protein [candidate division Zixibacteria bacterium]
MRDFPKPIVIVSKCIEFERCRYNGLIISSEAVRKLRGQVEFVPVCPEVEIGLGIPRDPVRIISTDGKPTLLQPATNRDVTEKMEKFAKTFLDSFKEIDGFILKSRSPSCGTKDVKVYSGSGKGVSSSRGSGFFGGAVLERFPHLAIEDEGRLTNFGIREHFLAKLFALAGFREIKGKASMSELVRFQRQNKSLLMAYSQKELRVLGRIVANHEKKPPVEVIKDYEQHLWNAFLRPAKDTSNINVLMHAIGHFSESLSSKEKSFFLNTLEEYRDERIPLSVPLSILKSWAVRFEDDYLMEQSFIEPYPEQLVEITDSGKGRNL